MSGLVGAGVSLRSKHFPVFLSEAKVVDWVEILADQYLNSHGVLLERLQDICAKYPVSMHCVALSLGSVDALDSDYLQQLKKIISIVKPLYVSDHLCWSTYNGAYSHDLLPLPFTAAACSQVCDKISRVQDYLKKPIILENISHYIDSGDDYKLEAYLLNEICARTGCGVLLDINNIYVSAQNLNANAHDYLSTINPKYVKQIHLGGYIETEHRLVDTHGAKVYDKVWDLFAAALARVGHVATCIEWDNNIPEWSVLGAEVMKAKRYLQDTPATINLNHANNKSYKLATAKDSLKGYQRKLWDLINKWQLLDDSFPESVHQQSMYQQRLLALFQVYPCCKRLLGEQKFISMARPYLLQQVSRFADITAGYETFIKFVAMFNDLPCYIAELAAYEWQWYQIFHGVNNGDIDLDSLQQQVAEYGAAVGFVLSPGLILHRATYPVLSLWEYAQEEYKGSEPNYEKGDYFYALHQRNGYVCSVAINYVMYKSLLQLRRAKTLSAWCDDCATENNFSPDLSAYFYEQGFISLVEVEEV